MPVGTPIANPISSKRSTYRSKSDLIEANTGRRRRCRLFVHRRYSVHTFPTCHSWLNLFIKRAPPVINFIPRKWNSTVMAPTNGPNLMPDCRRCLVHPNSSDAGGYSTGTASTSSQSGCVRTVKPFQILNLTRLNFRSRFSQARRTIFTMRPKQLFGRPVVPLLLALEF
jgi:NADH:ubiquinone oxidoreductase subunit